MMKIGDKMKKRKIKKGPKIVLILLIVFLAIGGLIINQKNQETEEKPKKQTKEEQKIEKLKSIPYYKKEYQKRYLEYQKENPNLSVENIVTYVNIGIDKPYYTNTKKAENLNTNLILVNKYNYLTEDYIPENLEPIDIAYARSGMQLVREAKEAFETLSEDAKKEGMNIIAMSSYRSYDYQVNLYDNYVATDGKEAADTYSARAGYSEHQTGLAVDVYNKVLSYTSFEETEEFNWMQENAYKYGFILRFPKDKVNITGYQYESWHYRYVGKEAAKYIHNHDLTLEEYYVKKVEKN
mgnify:FL=1